ncbi:uncharacterized protein DUF982 [Rhizobium sp. BK251]|nr:uncharacterized protein DUF982 [Rhizobium sp. BK251]
MNRDWTEDLVVTLPNGDMCRVTCGREAVEMLVRHWPTDGGVLRGQAIHSFYLLRSGQSDEGFMRTAFADACTEAGLPVAGI